MARLKTLLTTSLVIIAVAMISSDPAIADKPSWAGGGKQEKHKQKEQQGNSGDKSHHEKAQADFNDDSYFIDQHRMLIHDYYVHAYQTGHCPKGLAKKHNGCMPPGQAKKWAIGLPLPRDVVYYDLPSALANNIGPPPNGYRFVRVASDILMINSGTRMVVDAINDLGRN